MSFVNRRRQFFKQATGNDKPKNSKYFNSIMTFILACQLWQHYKVLSSGIVMKWIKWNNSHIQLFHLIKFCCWKYYNYRKVFEQTKTQYNQDVLLQWGCSTVYRLCASLQLNTNCKCKKKTGAYNLTSIQGGWDIATSIK